MKQRIISIILIICLAFMTFSCSKAPESITDNNTEQTEINASRIPMPAVPDVHVHRSTDVFTATVLDSESLPKNTRFADYQTTDAEPVELVLYIVEVKNTIRDFSVAENTKIGVVRFVREADEQSEKYYLPFEVGKTYLMCGDVQLLQNKPVIIADGGFCVEIKEDGSLVPLSIRSGEVFSEVKTYDEFLQDEAVKKVLENGTIMLPPVFNDLLKTDPMNIHLKSEAEQLEYSKQETDIYGVVLSEKEEVRKLIREAIPIESKKTVNIGADSK